MFGKQGRIKKRKYPIIIFFYLLFIKLNLNNLVFGNEHCTKAA